MSVDVGAVRAAVEGEGALGMAVYAVCDELEALRAEVERLRALLDAKSHEAGLFARRMEQAQRSRDKARAKERAAVVAWLRARVAGHERGVQAEIDAADTGDFTRSKLTEARKALDAIERGEHRREGEP